MSADTMSQASRPVAAGLFEGRGRAARLLGSRCTGCGAAYFPRTAACRNPRCDDPRAQDAPLSAAGTLYSFTVQAYRPPPLFRMDDWAPYAIGLVDLPEGLRVMGLLGGRAPQDWRIGEPVVMDTVALYRDEQGAEVLSYRFVPADAATGAAP